jgi:chromosome segregation ATPase
VKLATIEDHLQIACLHSNDNAESIEMLEKERLKLFETIQNITKEIHSIKLLFTNKEDGNSGEGKSLLPKESLILNEQAKLQEFFSQLIHDISSTDGSPVSPANSPASNLSSNSLSLMNSSSISADVGHLDTTAVNEAYLSSLSEQLKSSCLHEINRKQQEIARILQSIEETKNRITVVEKEIKEIHERIQRNQQKKEELIRSRLYLQSLLQSSNDLLQNCSEKLILDVSIVSFSCFRLFLYRVLFPLYTLIDEAI